MHGLIKGLLLKRLNNPILGELSDGAHLVYREEIVFTTDSFVVDPLFFPGGDIGKLSVCGTVNDLAVSGALPEYLSLALIIEEGFDRAILEKIIDSISLNARKAKVDIVTGDIKVVERGAVDKIFINTSGIGRLINKKRLSLADIRPDDAVIITGGIGQHGLSVMSKREGINLGFNIESDCASLSGLITPVLKKCKGIKFMRDPTRGGLGTTLNEIAEGSGYGIVIDEKNIPVSPKVKAACELLGIDPLYVANEGRAVLVVSAASAKNILRLLKKHPLGRHARLIGRITRKPRGRVILNTLIGTGRVIDMLMADPLPRIC